MKRGYICICMYIYIYICISHISNRHYPKKLQCNQQCIISIETCLRGEIPRNRGSIQCRSKRFCLAKISRLALGLYLMGNISQFSSE